MRPAVCAIEISFLLPSLRRGCNGMGHIRTTALVAACFAVLWGSPTSAQTLGADSLKKMVDTYEQNQIRFNRDYRGKEFEAILPFRAARETFFGGEYTVEFGTKGFLSELGCTVSDKDAVNRLIDWNKGDRIKVRGVVKDVSFGAVRLDDCMFEVIESAPQTR